MLSPGSANYPDGPQPRSPGAWDSPVEPSTRGSRLPERRQRERLRRFREQPAGSPAARNLIPGMLRAPGDDLASLEAHRLGFIQDLQPLVVLDLAKQCLRHPDLS